MSSSSRIYRYDRGPFKRYVGQRGDYLPRRQLGLCITGKPGTKGQPTILRLWLMVFSNLQELFMIGLVSGCSAPPVHAPPLFHCIRMLVLSVRCRGCTALKRLPNGKPHQAQRMILTRPESLSWKAFASEINEYSASRTCISGKNEFEDSFVKIFSSITSPDSAGLN